jgi:DNA-binding transcriptional ArsR family regulator
MLSVSRTFEALGDPTRRQIMAFLAQGEASAGEIAEQFNVTFGAVSQHLKVLRDAGLVSVRSVARQRFYRVAPAPLADAAAWLIRTAGRQA